MIMNSAIHTCRHFCQDVKICISIAISHIYPKVTVTVHGEQLVHKNTNCTNITITKTALGTQQPNSKSTSCKLH